MGNEETKEELAKEVRLKYQREYYRKNRKRVNAKQREWRAANPDKVRQYNQNYWLKKAEEKQAQ